MHNPFLRVPLLSISSILALGLAATTQAESDEKIPEMKTAGGKAYHEVRVTKVTPSEISIMHESGVARVPLKDLPDDLKAKFGYDAAKAQAYSKAASEAEKQTAEAEKQKAENQALLKTAKAQVFIVDRETKDGLLVTDVTGEFLNFIELSNMADRARSNGQEAVHYKYDIIGTGGGIVVDSSCRGDQQYLLIGIPKKEQYVRDAAIGGLFVVAGTALSSDGTRIKMLRFVGLQKMKP